MQVAAGYIHYCPSTMMVLTSDFGVDGFTYEQSLGDYHLSHPNMRISKKGNIYSINESRFADFPESVKEYIGHCQSEEYSGWYIGYLAADFHRNLIEF